MCARTAAVVHGESTQRQRLAEGTPNFAGDWAVTAPPPPRPKAETEGRFRRGLRTWPVEAGTGYQGEYEKAAVKGRRSHTKFFFYRGMCAKEEQWQVVQELVDSTRLD